VKPATEEGERSRKWMGCCETSVVTGRCTCTAMRKLRIGLLRFGTGRQKLALDDKQIPTLSRRACRPWYGLQFWRGESAGVAKRPRELISHPQLPPSRFATFSSRYGPGVVQGFEAYVGSKTTIRIQNVDHLGFKEKQDVALVFSARTDKVQQQKSLPRTSDRITTRLSLSLVAESSL
jgi:hypothetical protein